jgi:hypothetical protein
MNITKQSILEDQLHFAKKKEQRVWGSGEHEAARAEVERIEKELEKLVDSRELK